MAMVKDERGSYKTSTGRGGYTDRREDMRKGGGGYDAGPGRETMPGAAELDRPRSPCGTFGRTGTTRRGIDAGIRSIQD